MENVSHLSEIICLIQKTINQLKWFSESYEVKKLKSKLEESKNVVNVVKVNILKKYRSRIGKFVVFSYQQLEKL